MLHLCARRISQYFAAYRESFEGFSGRRNKTVSNPLQFLVQNLLQRCVCAARNSNLKVSSGNVCQNFVSSKNLEKHE